MDDGKKAAVVIGVGAGLAGLAYLLTRPSPVRSYAFSIDGEQVVGEITLEPGSTHRAGVFIKNETGELQSIFLTVTVVPDIGLGWFDTITMAPHSVEHVEAVKPIVIPDMPGTYKIHCKLAYRSHAEFRERIWEGILPGQIFIA